MSQPYFLEICDNNHTGKIIEPSQALEDIKKNANRTIYSLLEENGESVVAFPLAVGEQNRKIGGEQIFSLIEEGGDYRLRTNNIMGYVGVNETDVSISSRFARKEGQDYFLYYLLSKVFNTNFTSLQHGLSRESIFDFLIQLFSHYLKKAMRQGLYKSYRRNHYNDSNIRGTINISRHIQRNIPYRGSVAYSTREYDYDNPITQLIRHTIEHIKAKPYGRHLLYGDSDMASYVTQIVESTPTYSRFSKNRVIGENLKPISHPYYVNYKNLQNICVRILQHEGLKYGRKRDKIRGILFDGAWLWEEYVGYLLDKVEVLGNQKSATIYLIESGSELSYHRTPDYMCGEREMIIDAKYKWMGSQIDRDDMHQIISYMYSTKAEAGALFYPQMDVRDSYVGELRGYGGRVYALGLPIPVGCESLNKFSRKIEVEEKKLLKEISEIKEGERLE